MRVRTDEENKICKPRVTSHKLRVTWFAFHILALNSNDNYVAFNSFIVWQVHSYALVNILCTMNKQIGNRLVEWLIDSIKKKKEMTQIYIFVDTRQKKDNNFIFIRCNFIFSDSILLFN